MGYIVLEVCFPIKRKQQKAIVFTDVRKAGQPIMMSRWLAQGRKHEPWTGFEVIGATIQSHSHSIVDVDNIFVDNWSTVAEKGSSQHE